SDDPKQNLRSFLRVDIPFCVASIFPVIFLIYLYRKDEEAWKRDKVLLLPTFTVLGIIWTLAMYMETHLSLIDWLDIGHSAISCNLTFNSLLTLALTPYLFLPIIPLLQLADCFKLFNAKITQYIAYSWAAILVKI
ncbi:hypothetical protein PMAYCL1PPCAC_20926, partial [Pristionchus mayeri]